MAEDIDRRHSLMVPGIGSQRHGAGAVPADENTTVALQSYSWPWDCACPWEEGHGTRAVLPQQAGGDSPTDTSLTN